MVPLQTSGVIDIEASHLSNQDVLAHAFTNVCGAEHESYAVRHGGFINEYERRDDEGNRSVGDSENPNHLLGAFPHLFPYGMGGFETACSRSVSYEVHAKWCMQYADGHFRQDLHFMFQVFGVIQKHQVCRSAVLEVRKKAFQDHEQAFSQLTPSNLLEASKEEAKKQPHSNHTIRSLKQHLSTVRAKVMGTDESRTKVRSYIWGMTMMKNPPSLWITINPMDTHDPVVQVCVQVIVAEHSSFFFFVFSGQEINLDDFDATAGPESGRHAFIIANDPYAVAKFFSLYHCIDLGRNFWYIC